MAQSIVKDEINNAVPESIIDAKIQKLRDYDPSFLSTKRHHQLTKSASIAEIEASLSNVLTLSHNLETKYNSEINNIWESVNQLRDELAKNELARVQNQKERTEEMILFEQKLANGLPRFRDAHRIYSEEYLIGVIEEIRNECREVNNQIASVTPEIEALVLECEIQSIKATEISKFTKTNEICGDLNMKKDSEIKAAERLNKELEEIIKLNKRKIARLV